MDVMNRLDENRFRHVDDLLAFISIYDDEARTQAYLELLRAHAHAIENRVCVEAGCGMGLFSAEMAKLGARKVYAVEQNPLMAAVAREQLRQWPQVEVVEMSIQEFEPGHEVDVLVHEFYGQFLFDEDLAALGDLRFQPGLVLPDGGSLYCSVLPATEYLDDTVTAAALRELQGVLVSGLFAETGDEFQQRALSWQYGQPFALRQRIALHGREGDLLAFALEVSHAGRAICRAGECDNWAMVWTPRAGDVCEISFIPDEGGHDIEFSWLS